MPHTAPRAHSFETSLFCQRLEALAKDADTNLQNLTTATKRLVGHAEDISKQVVQFLPQFTLHDSKHLWNVLSFMEELAGGKEGIDKLEAGDCAMAVWACFLHDLGMVLEAGEVSAIEAADRHDLTPGSGDPPFAPAAPRVQAWRGYRDGHPLWESIRRDPKAKDRDMKLGIIRAAFIRDTHARLDSQSGQCRIADWLGFLTGSDRLIAEALDNYALDQNVILTAVSHNQGISWLPHQLRALTGDELHADFHAGLGSIHWTWIGWLLRLADVFDCDASRTPSILFDHGGITDPRSGVEWRKHLSIRQPPVWKAGSSKNRLLYTCEQSPSPIVEKSLNQIMEWMNDEISKCGSAWGMMPAEHREEITLALPSKAEVKIKSRKGGYIYQDIEFRLERDAVVELLMGESLYGGPELALRELVQNALDAVHLRDQRNQLATALESKGGVEKPLQAHEYWSPGRSGEVHVEWGTEPDGRSWIRVSDNGVGMTLGTMRRFLTQVGRSYYKSPDFLSEQEQMRRHGLVCSAISQFGIGFLSVFMLADHVEIHTRPVGAAHRPDKTQPEWEENGRFPFRADIHGPHGLLAFYPDENVRQPGTTVTLWLKDGENGEKLFALPEWDRELVLARLRKEFYNIPLGNKQKEELENQTSATEERRYCDPAFEIGRMIVWPLYPVFLGPHPGSIRVDGRFHFAELMPLDRPALVEAVQKWGETLPEAATADWRACDWRDPETGSRIRLVAAQPENEIEWSADPQRWATLPEALASGKCRLALHTLCEAGLPKHDRRYQCLVNGVRIVPGFVPSGSERDCQLPLILRNIPAWPGTGGWLWLDLRGAAMPRLRADRSAMTSSLSSLPDLGALQERWLAAWSGALPAWLRGVVLSSDFRRKATPLIKTPLRVGLPSLSPVLLCRSLFHEREACLATTLLFRGQRKLIARDLQFIDARRDYDLPIPALNFEHELALTISTDIEDAIGLARGLDSRSILGSDLSSSLVIDFDRILTCSQKISRPFLQFIRLHILSESFQPSLEEALPALGWGPQRGTLRDYHLAGPLHFVLKNPLPPEHWLDAYDAAVPATGLALRRLRKARPSWLEHRAERALFLLPLLSGGEPEGWRDKLRRNHPFARLMLFLPNPDHCEWLFIEHPQEEWTQGSASALWDLETGEVLYADGIHTEESLRTEGRTLREWLGFNK
ncbi:MAG: hypothetical protein V4726_11715 [Verrucomicrobiota bacterium]